MSVSRTISRSERKFARWDAAGRKSVMSFGDVTGPGPLTPFRDMGGVKARHVPQDGHARSFSRTSSLTARAFALPPVSFITWPTKKPSKPSFPPR